LIVTGVKPPAVTTPFLMILCCFPVVFPVLKDDDASKIGAPKSIFPVAKA